jgi:hypothetical protein
LDGIIIWLLCANTTTIYYNIIKFSCIKVHRDKYLKRSIVLIFNP